MQKVPYEKQFALRHWDAWCRFRGMEKFWREIWHYNPLYPPFRDLDRPIDLRFHRGIIAVQTEFQPNCKIYLFILSYNYQPDLYIELFDFSDFT